MTLPSGRNCSQLMSWRGKGAQLDTVGADRVAARGLGLRLGQPQGLPLHFPVSGNPTNSEPFHPGPPASPMRGYSLHSEMVVASFAGGG